MIIIDVISKIMEQVNLYIYFYRSLCLSLSPSVFLCLSRPCLSSYRGLGNRLKRSTFLHLCSSKCISIIFYSQSLCNEAGCIHMFVYGRDQVKLNYLFPYEIWVYYFIAIGRQMRNAMPLLLLLLLVDCFARILSVYYIFLHRHTLNRRTHERKNNITNIYLIILIFMHFE